MFSGRLRELRIEHKLNQTELGDVFGLSTSAIGMYEQGRRSPDIELVEKMADYFNVSTDYLLGRSDNRQTVRKVIGSNFALLRNGRTYEEFAQYLNEKIGFDVISPFLLERYEKELEQPISDVIDCIASAESLKPDFFYNNNTTETIELMRLDKSDTKLTFLDKDIQEWIHSPQSKEYIEFIYKAFKSGITKEALKKAHIAINLD